MKRPRNSSGLKARPVPWTCPTCARQFARKVQSHSCQTQTVSHHLRLAEPQVIEAYKFLVSCLEKFGPLRTNAVKSSISFASKHNFAAVTITRKCLRLSFMATQPIDDERITKVEQLGPARFALGLVINTRQDLGPSVMAWLRAAYSLRSH